MFWKLSAKDYEIINATKLSIYKQAKNHGTFFNIAKSFAHFTGTTGRIFLLLFLR